MAVDYIVLSTYLDGEVRDEDRRLSIEAHLNASAVYAAEFDRLRRTSDLMQPTPVSAGFHQQLMRRVQELEKQAHLDTPLARWLWRGTAVAAAMALGLAAIDYTGFVQLRPAGGTGPFPNSLPPSMHLPLAAPMLAANLAAIADEEPVPEEETASETNAVRHTHLPLVLRGTVGGAQPMAVISDTLNNTQTTYRVGDSIAEGVTLVDVRYGQVILDHGGSYEILSTAGAAEGAMPAMEGQWEFIASSGDVDALTCQITEDRGLLYMTSPNGDPLAHGVLTSNHLRITLPTDRGLVQLEGDLNTTRDEVILTGVVPTGDINSPHLKLSLTGRKTSTPTPQQ